MNINRFSDYNFSQFAFDHASSFWALINCDVIDTRSSRCVTEGKSNARDVKHLDFKNYPKGNSPYFPEVLLLLVISVISM